MKRYFLLIPMVLSFIVVSGCNESGMNLGGDVSPGSQTTQIALLNSPFFGSSESALGIASDSDASASGDLVNGVGILSVSDASAGGDIILGNSSDLQVALVHNPEPASLLLLGAGFVGAALMRRRKKE